MTTGQKVFKRIEKKYRISSEQFSRILPELEMHMRPDSHKNSTVFSLYFDTPDDLLIRRSVDKPVYKEKLRLRTYGVPDEDTVTYVEIKKKFKKVVYKRRASMKFSEARDFLISGKMPQADVKQQQIINEIKWFLKKYAPVFPSVLISYNRVAYYGIEDRGLRITFDDQLMWRETELSPAEGAWGSRLLEDGQGIMEIKIPGAMPLWLVDILSREKIYPSSFSKAGTAYNQKLKGGNKHA